MHLLNKETPEGKGLRTGLQAVVGAVVGLFTTIWAVDGVPEAVTEYLQSNWVGVAVGIGLPAGLIAFFQNRLGK